MNGSSSTITYTPYDYTQQFQYVPGMVQQENIENVLWTNNSKAIGTSVIVVETSYSFTSPSSFIIKGVHVMTSSYATIPRLANYVGFPYANSTLNPPTSSTTTNALTLSNGAQCNYRS